MSGKRPLTSHLRRWVVIICAVVIAAAGGLVTWLVTRPATLPRASCGAAMTHSLNSSTQLVRADTGALGCFGTAARRCSPASIEVDKYGADSGTVHVFVIGSGGPHCPLTDWSQNYGVPGYTGPVTSMPCRLTAVTGKGVMLNCEGRDLLIPATVSRPDLG